MAFRPSAQPVSGRSLLGNPTKLHGEVSDQVWNAMILMALKYQRRIGRYHNQRYDRKHVYFVLIIGEIASILVDSEVIHPWPGGFRKLHAIERAVIVKFSELHGKSHFDT